MKILGLYIADTDLTKYEHIMSVRVTDGARLVASRVVVDEQTPVRWTIMLKDKLEMVIEDELQLFEDAAGRVRKQYTTTELLGIAQQKGFDDWQQVPRGFMQGWKLVEGEYQENHIPRYPDPDPTPYPTD